MIKSAAPEQLAELPDDSELVPSDNALLLSRRAVLKQIAGSTVALGVVGSLAACSSIQPNAAVTNSSATNASTTNTSATNSAKRPDPPFSCALDLQSFVTAGTLSVGAVARV